MSSESVEEAGEKQSDRCLTFRKRRLSLPMHHLSTGEQPPQQTDDKAHNFRKRRLSLTQNKPDEAEWKRRRGSEASMSVGSVHSHQGALRPKTMHSGELIVTDGPPPSPAVHSDNVLYTLQPIPPLSLPAAAVDNKHPKWRKRQTVSSGDEHKLPFPRDIVGTYSCHGVEPVYDSSYEDDDVDDDDDWLPGKPAAIATQATSHDAEEDAVLPEIVGKPAVAAIMAAEETVQSCETNQENDKNNKATMAAKINQDRGGVAYPYGNSSKTALFAVYDGHGQGGELVSQFALHEIQRRLEKHPDFEKNVANAFKETFLAVDEALKHEPIIEPLFAGTTACVVLLADDKMAIANAGDSRAVIARRNGTSWNAIELTEDQNPDLPAEKKRITSCGGFVSPSPGPGLSSRVWLDAMCTQIGLAMARSIGDHAVASVGVIAEPVVTFHDVQDDDEFLILASDGVWEFLDSQQAVKIVGENLHRGATKACQALIEAAAAKWHQEEGEYRDDITAIVIRLQLLWKKPRHDNKS